MTNAQPGSSGTEVTVVDVRMPFGSMVVFMIKWALAAIPAVVILVAVWAVLAALLGGLIFFAR